MVAEAAGCLLDVERWSLGPLSIPGSRRPGRLAGPRSSSALGEELPESRVLCSPLRQWEKQGLGCGEDHGPVGRGEGSLASCMWGAVWGSPVPQAGRRSGCPV